MIPSIGGGRQERPGILLALVPVGLEGAAFRFRQQPGFNQLRHVTEEEPGRPLPEGRAGSGETQNRYEVEHPEPGFGEQPGKRSPTLRSPPVRRQLSNTAASTRSNAGLGGYSLVAW